MLVEEILVDHSLAFTVASPFGFLFRVLKHLGLVEVLF